uniref:Uncharacterized protein n=1 Tax=viral metagenome TaxID=1070528 RepID=A0A6C0JES3_9ZZZZ
MESIPTYKRITKKSKKKNDVYLGNIIEEYCLKRNQFNPQKASPDMFNKKLQHRMQSYYNTLYTLSSSPSKY